MNTLLFITTFNGHSTLIGIAIPPPLPLNICLSIKFVVDKYKWGGGSAELLIKVQLLTRTSTLLREASSMLKPIDRPPLLPWNGFLVK